MTQQGRIITMIQQFYIPIKVLFGPGSIEQIGQEAKKLGTRAMIVTYPDIRRLGFLDIVLKDLESQGIETSVFEELEPNPRTTTIDQAARIARGKKIDLVIGMGGGSAMDAAKGIALVSSGEAPVWDYMVGKARARDTVPNLIQVPTLAGTGSELNPICVFTHWESHEKRFIFSALSENLV